MKNPANLKPSMEISGWLLVEQLGKGGNGVVWKATKGEREAALKFLKASNSRDDKRLLRFRDEVQAMLACADIEGVVPIIESSIPDDPAANEYAWFAMELGTPLSKDERAPKALDDVVRFCLDLSRTLSDMHSRSFSHRDIKPENVLRLGDKWHLGDFGLVDFPDKAALTEKGEKLGPMFYIAPEMLNDAAASDGTAADVYSLAKLLWKLGSGQRYPMPGTQSTSELALRLSSYVSQDGAHSLDQLMEAMTQVDPTRRPEMKEVKRQLEAWLATPEPATGDAMDLSNLAKAIAAIKAPLESEQQRQAGIAGAAAAHRQGAFEAFRPVLDEIKQRLQAVGVERFSALEPSGGNGAFWRAVTDDFSVGNGGDGSWLYQFSYDAALWDERMYATLTFGVNLAIHNLKGEKGELHDIYAPVLTAAGYILHTRTTEGKEQTKLLWGEHGEFRYGQPDEAAVIARLCDGLRGNLQMAAASLVASVQAR
jgi:hypothetical protein